MGAAELYNTGADAVILSLAKAYLAIGTLRPASTDDAELFGAKVPVWAQQRKTSNVNVRGETEGVNRFAYDELYSLQLDEYFLPVSQEFNLRAKKNLNVSHLVDGVDIIQQTRKESKMIECKMRMTLGEEGNENLKLYDVTARIRELSDFLTGLYDSDKVFEINNDVINNMLGVTHVIMTEYRFTPRRGFKTFDFEFTLQEVEYGENVLTFNLREVNSDQDSTQRQLIP